MTKLTRNHDTGFDWMREAIYEPRPILRPSPRAPMPLGWRIFLVLAGLFIIGCGLAGMAV